MKTLTVSIFAFLFLISGVVMAQNRMEVIGVPLENYGYLIWDSDSTIIKYHHCEIYKHELSGNDTISTMLKKHEIWDRNYFRLDDVYWKTQDTNFWYSVKLIGLDSNHDVVDVKDASYGPIGGVGEFQCDWECVSSNYAYRIKNVLHGGTYALSQDVAYSYVNEETGARVPYYEWFSFDQYKVYTGYNMGGAPGTGDSRYHDIPSWNSEFSAMTNPNYHLDRIITVPNNGSYCDDNGVSIDGPEVYGIKKALWVWWQYPLRKDDLTNDHCTNDPPFSHIMNLMNNWTTGDEINLQCADDLADSCQNGGTDGTGGLDDGEDEAEQDCGITFSGWNGPWSSEFECAPLAIQISNNGEVEFGEFLTHTELFKITSLTKGAENLIYTNGSEILNSEGVPEIPSFEMPAGLYRITLKLPNDRLRYIVKETHEDIDFHVPHSSFFSGLIFPNPNTEGFYFIDISASARLRTLYEVFNGQGHKLYEQDFDLPVDHSGTHKITPDVTFPNGFIYHKFTFGDGSHVSYTTLQQ